MALIKCPNCGNQMSDKALCCPACGYENQAQEKKIQNFCIECGNKLSENDTVCSVCGCPINKEHENLEQLQKVEVASIQIPKISKQKKTTLIVSIVLLVILIIVAIAGIFFIRQHTKTIYKENLSAATSSMIMGAIKAEDSGNLIHDVWYNTIYKESDSKTDKYTKTNHSFNEDFNTSLTALMSDDDFKKDIESIKDNQDSTDYIMKDLVNPPEEYKEAYEKLQDFYDSYLELTNLVISPTGSLSSYTSNFNEADSATSNAYKAMQRYIN